MLSQEELHEFLALVLAFCSQTKTSARGFARLFSLTPFTAARWLRVARGNGEIQHLFYTNTDPIKRAILQMNLQNNRDASYRRIAAIDDKAKHDAALKAFMLKAQ